MHVWLVIGIRLIVGNVWLVGLAGLVRVGSSLDVFEGEAVDEQKVDDLQDKGNHCISNG